MKKAIAKVSNPNKITEHLGSFNVGKNCLELPTVSVITTTYKDLEGLVATADSVLGQVFPLEWIVVDGGSGKRTVDFLRSVQYEKHTFKWISEKDEGIYDGMNKGFELSTGDVILFLNSGDLLVNELVISDVAKDYCTKGWLWCNALTLRQNTSGRLDTVWEYLNPTLAGLALGGKTFCHQSTFYSRSLLNNLMPYKAKYLSADHELNLRAFLIKEPRILPMVTTIFQNGGVSSKRKLTSSFLELRKIRLELGIKLARSQTADLILTLLYVTLVYFSGIFWKMTHLNRFKV